MNTHTHKVCYSTSSIVNFCCPVIVKLFIAVALIKEKIIVHMNTQFCQKHMYLNMKSLTSVWVNKSNAKELKILICTVCGPVLNRTY